MDNETGTPVVSSRVLDKEAPNPDPSGNPELWKTPLLELLDLLKIIDNSQPTPKVDGPRFCFQPSHDLSEISRIFLSVSTSLSIQYDIDLKTIRPLGSNAVPPAAIKLQEYANHVLRRIQLFRDRLLEHAVINDSSCFLHVDLFTCPLCLGPLASCIDCDSKVACSNPECRGSLVIDSAHCYEHGRMACHACLAKSDAVPSMICCAMCQAWCCKEDTDWCAGLIIHPALGTEELAKLSHQSAWGCKSIVRSHPPKPSLCKLCTDFELAPGWKLCRNNTEEVEADHCPSQIPYNTQFRVRGAYCPECVHQSPGRRCACELSWLCDTCSAIRNKFGIYPYLITCPRCGVDYCTGPDADVSCGDYIEICGGCKGVPLCNACQEEEELPGETQTEKERPKQVTFALQCGFCEAWSCATCYASERTATCVLCNRWVCYGCVSDPEYDVIERCPFCAEYLCRFCRVHHRDCPGIIMLMAHDWPRPIMTA